MDRTNASAIVTGGAGLRAATVRRLAKKGAKVAIADMCLMNEGGAGDTKVSAICAQVGL